jgi:non-specific serine/threonine protein kinase
VERLVGLGLVNLGDTLNALGDHAAAQAALVEALAMAERQGDQRLRAHALNNLAETAALGGDFVAACRLADQALGVAQEVGDRLATGSCLLNLARFEVARGSYEPATRLLAEAVVLLREQGNPAALAEALDALAGPVLARGDAELATRLIGGADAMRRWRGASLGAVARQTRSRVEQASALRLSERRRQAALEEGRGWSLEQAGAEALAAALASSPVRAGEAPAQETAERAYDLTARELEVLRLLVEAKTDREIGETLFISPRTAMSHVSNILGKLGVETRTGAATFAVRHGLV